MVPIGTVFRGRPRGRFTLASSTVGGAPLTSGDKQDDVVDFSKSESPFEDGHDLLTATLNLHTPKPTQHSFSCRNYNAICETTLTEYLKGLDWSVA